MSKVTVLRAWIHARCGSSEQRSEADGLLDAALEEAKTEGAREGRPLPEQGAAARVVELDANGWCMDDEHDFNDEDMAAGRPSNCRRCPAVATPIASMVLSGPVPFGMVEVPTGRCAARRCRGSGVATRACGFCDGCCGHARGVCADEAMAAVEATR